MNFVRKINVSLLLVTSFCIFFVGVHFIYANISTKDAEQLLKSQGINSTEKNVGIYQTAINNGMSNKQATQSINQLQSQTIRGSLGIGPLKATTNNGSWHYDTVGGDGKLIFTPNEHFKPMIKDKNNRTLNHLQPIAQRRAQGIEETVDEEYGRNARKYNTARNNYEKALNDSPLKGTQAGRLLLGVKSVDSNNPKLQEELHDTTVRMNNQIRDDVFNKVATIAQKNHLDLNNLNRIKVMDNCPPCYMQVQVGTPDGKVYDANGEVNPQTDGGSPANGDKPQTDGGSPANGDKPQTDGGSPANGDPGSSINNSQETGGIVPCGKNTGEGETKSSACTICHLIDGIHNIVQKLVEWMVFAALVIITVAGIMYIVSAGNPAMITMAKTAMKNALIGIIIILTAFMMITFIVNKAFNNSGAQLKVEEGGLESSGFGRMWNFECK